MPFESGPMTEAMYYVLLALMNPNHGYQLMNSIKEVSKGRVNMGPGTLYGVLSRMLNEGLIIVIDYDGRRRTYAITPEGKDDLLKEYIRLMNLVEDGKNLKGVLADGNS